MSPEHATAIIHWQISSAGVWTQENHSETTEMNGHRDSSPGIGRQVTIRFMIIRPFSFLNTQRRHRSLNEPPPPPPTPPQTNNIIV